TWANPIPVNPTTLNVQTISPSVAVARDGVVAVMFYDTRNAVPDDPSFWGDVWVSFFDKNLEEYLGEVRLTPESFDIRQFMHRRRFDVNYFAGDYFKITDSENDFVAVFAITN